jgi:hypothetical protein
MDQQQAKGSSGELGRLVGEWTLTAGPPGEPPWPGEARVRFEWIEGGAFLAERWSLDGSGLPEGTPTSGTTIYGYDEAHGTYVQLHYDNRGVRRVYQMGLRDGEWTLHRDAPPFAQRYRGTFSPDGKTIAGRWEIQESGEAWRTDFDGTYTRVT